MTFIAVQGQMPRNGEGQGHWRFVACFYRGWRSRRINIGNDNWVMVLLL